MTRQEFLELHAQAVRDVKRRVRRVLLWGGVASMIVLPSLYILIDHLGDYPQYFEFLRRFGKRGMLIAGGTAALLLAFLVKPVRGYGVTCPNCHETITGWVTLGMITGN